MLESCNVYFSIQRIGLFVGSAAELKLFHNLPLGDITANMRFRNQRLLYSNLTYAKLLIFAIHYIQSSSAQHENKYLNNLT